MERKQPPRLTNEEYKLRHDAPVQVSCAFSSLSFRKKKAAYLKGSERFQAFGGFICSSKPCEDTEQWLDAGEAYRSLTAI
ncbi:hypothetical protein [Paenibacillus chitinolyticus]|uniref:hypothetical protein n=1 Tax=Paenibacillus chitinolyticus TaxID=79263 RepID=UPI001C439F12|nr:hypothetical protein [Paenibacillus chitinolyticus]MBV6716684.1 hypothetical protein [Paenibacillus chitinolyticus]